jgi:hypothetical protein
MQTAIGNGVYQPTAYAQHTSSFTAAAGFNRMTGTTTGQTATLLSPGTGGQVIVIKNYSSQSWTIASLSGSQIVATGGTSASSSVTVTSGSATEFWADGSLWNQK